MVSPGVSGPLHRTSRLAGAVSIALHGLAVCLLAALGGKHSRPARQTVLTPIEVVAPASDRPAPQPLSPTARMPPAARSAAPRATAGGGHRAPVPRAQPTARSAVQSLADVQVRYDAPRTFAEPGAAGAAVSSAFGAWPGHPLGDGIGNLDTPEPPARVSLRRSPRPRHDYLKQQIPGASRFAGQIIQVLLSIDDRGRVRSVQIVHGVDRALDRQMIERVRSFEFDPALDDDGVAIEGTRLCQFEIVQDDDWFETRGPR